MKGRYLFLLMLLLVTCAAGCTKSDSRKDDRLHILTIYSEVLGKDMISQVYLPDNYDSNQKYPVLYFLPSNGGSSYTVINQFGIMESADKLTSDNQIEPMIIVALGIDNSFGMNTGTETREIVTSSEKSFDEGRYEDYIVNEAIPYIDEHFSTDSSKESRYIGGYSMGGLASLHIAFRHPDLFSKAGGHSPSLFVNDFTDKTVSDWLYPNEELRKERDPILLAQECELSGLTVYLDTDEGGVNVDGCQKLYDALLVNGVDAEYSIFSGTHGFAYCKDYMGQYLLFYGAK